MPGISMGKMNRDRETRFFEEGIYYFTPPCEVVQTSDPQPRFDGNSLFYSQHQPNSNYGTLPREIRSQSRAGHTIPILNCRRCTIIFDSFQQLEKHYDRDDCCELRPANAAPPVPAPRASQEARSAPPRIIHEPSQTEVGGVPCFEVQGALNGLPVKALPDTGCPVDGISHEFATRAGLAMQPSRMTSIRILGNHQVRILGVVLADFQFRNEETRHRRSFYVIQNAMCDLLLGRDFLQATRTLSSFSHRIVRGIRPCIRSGPNLFLLDESPRDRLQTRINGCDASAFPDTGSDVMAVSAAFARRNGFKIHRHEKYRTEIRLIDRTTVRTEGMVFGAELRFDLRPGASKEFTYDSYRWFVNSFDSLMEKKGHRKATAESIFICDLHVVEGLPCDIILSNEFIFTHQVFSRFKLLSHTELPLTSQRADLRPENCLLFMRLKRPFRRRRPTSRDTNVGTCNYSFLD